jgi:hypothetical protein
LPWLAKALARDLKGWTPAMFTRKLDQLTRVPRQIQGGRGPDRLGVCEVENRYVRDRLCEHLNAAMPHRA